MASIPTAELIDQVERSFLCATSEKEDLQRIPLLQEFENEMKIYQVKNFIQSRIFFIDICRFVYLTCSHYLTVGMFIGFALI